MTNKRRDKFECIFPDGNHKPFSVLFWAIYLRDELSVIASYEIYTEWNLISNLNVHQIGTLWIPIKINGCN